MPIDHLTKESDHYKQVISCNSCGKLFYPDEDDERACSICLSFFPWEAIEEGLSGLEDDN